MGRQRSLKCLMEIFNGSTYDVEVPVNNAPKETVMIKRSLNKRCWTTVNYNKRLFVLNNQHLVYYEVYEDETSRIRRRREKGRIQLETIHTVETAAHFTKRETGINEEIWPFLIGYRIRKNDYSLFLFALKKEDRIDWILAIRAACLKNTNIKSEFHPAPWNGKKWPCCLSCIKFLDGCSKCGDWASNTSFSTLELSE